MNWIVFRPADQLARSTAILRLRIADGGYIVNSLLHTEQTRATDVRRSLFFRGNVTFTIIAHRPLQY